MIKSDLQLVGMTAIHGWDNTFLVQCILDYPNQSARMGGGDGQGV